jgi:phospholipase D-like protein
MKRSAMATIKTIKGPWADTFYDFVGLATNNLLIASPFIKQSQSRAIIRKLEGTGRLSKIHLGVLTDLRPDNIMSGALDVEALLDFSDSARSSTITYLPNLHAKVYIADQRAAIITSANLTDGGLQRNFEYGLLIDDAAAVGAIRHDLDQYSSLGAIVTRDALQSLREVAEELKFLRQEAPKEALGRAFKRNSSRNCNRLRSSCYRFAQKEKRPTGSLRIPSCTFLPGVRAGRWSYILGSSNFIPTFAMTTRTG